MTDELNYQTSPIVNTKDNFPNENIQLVNAQLADLDGRVIGRADLGTLDVGREADVAVFQLRRGRFGYTDCGRAKIVGNVKLENRLTIRAGRIVYDPTGLSMVPWRRAPARYFTVPNLQGVDPRATADPDELDK